MEALDESKTRVLIAEDMKLVARILASYINFQPDMEVAGEAGDGREAIEAYEDLAPDVVLMDISMPRLDGIRATREILSTNPDAKVVILTAHENGPHAVLAVEAGAKGYMNKDCDPKELMSAIRGISSGEDILPTGIPEQVASNLRAAGSASRSDEKARPHLTNREIEIVKALAGGKSNKQIATTMFISERTVRNHASNIYRKLSVYDRTQAVLRAARHGFIDLHAISIGD